MRNASQRPRVDLERLNRIRCEPPSFRQRKVSCFDVAFSIFRDEIHECNLRTFVASRPVERAKATNNKRINSGHDL